ncbi:alginate export family protein [Altericroceibacterium xinjiangense]|uniref:alginate export family protein n=1 Tax=Altericroceibacterium xinjiangense TaxID=762261 RepID=UPI000F7FA04F|nr:alginate export family protein [Altericroceibacterium xinjiangense]
MNTRSCLASGLGAAVLALSSPAFAQEPVVIGEGITLDPILELRMRYERVEQDNALQDADALTARLRAGFEVKAGDFAVLGEGLGTVALTDSYNAFAFPVVSDQRRPLYSVVSDAENLEINRLQLSWTGSNKEVIVGRQRIALDDWRWVSAAPWRQNEQTFDAVRAQAAFGPMAFDATYAISQRTAFGRDAGPHQAYDGDFIFLNSGVNAGPVKLKGFSYLIDYDDPLVEALSSQTYGVLATANVPLVLANVDLKASYARQLDWRTGARDYAADYMAAEAGASVLGFGVTGGWEKLGSDNGFALQTPLAARHRFNGLADMFVTTPNAGLEDAYVTIGRKFTAVPLLPGLNAALTYHQFDSDVGDVEYGHEWDATLGFNIGRVSLLAVYADYDAVSFAVDTTKIYLMAGVSF